MPYSVLKRAMKKLPLAEKPKKKKIKRVDEKGYIVDSKGGTEAEEEMYQEDEIVRVGSEEEKALRKKKKKKSEKVGRKSFAEEIFE